MTLLIPPAIIARRCTYTEGQGIVSSMSNPSATDTSTETTLFWDSVRLEPCGTYSPGRQESSALAGYTSETILFFILLPFFLRTQKRYYYLTDKFQAFQAMSDVLQHHNKIWLTCWLWKRRERTPRKNIREDGLLPQTSWAKLGVVSLVKLDMAKCSLCTELQAFVFSSGPTVLAFSFLSFIIF